MYAHDRSEFGTGCCVESNGEGAGGGQEAGRGTAHTREDYKEYTAAARVQILSCQSGVVCDEAYGQAWADLCTGVCADMA